MSDPVQHIRHFWDKMMVYSSNDLLLCLTFLSCLKGVASDWFYTLTHYSLHNFEEVTKVFLTQYVSRRVAKKNNHHFFTVKMRQGDDLKSYISYFQSQLVKVPNCGENVVVLYSLAGCKFLTSYINIC